MSAVFAVKQNGEVKKFTVNRRKVNIPGFGVMTAEEFVTNPDAIEFVLKHPNHQHILKEVKEEASLKKEKIAEKTSNVAETEQKEVAEESPKQEVKPKAKPRSRKKTTNP